MFGFTKKRPKSVMLNDFDSPEAEAQCKELYEITTEPKYEGDYPIGTKVAASKKGQEIGKVIGYRYALSGVWFTRLTTYYEIELNDGSMKTYCQIGVWDIKR